MTLPEPADLTSLLVRTDRSDDHAWQEAVAAASAPVPTRYGTFAAAFTVVDDPSLHDTGVRDLVAMPCDGHLDHLFVADALTMRDPQRTLLVLDRDTEHGQPGRTFRVPPAQAWSVQNNLCLANMDFHEFADAADRTHGVFAGFDEA